MPERFVPETANVSFQLDPALHLIMKGAKTALGLPTLNAVYGQAVSEFIDNHPEIAETLLGELQAEEAIVAGAVERLRSVTPS
jgi:hypothetical protein